MNKIILVDGYSLLYRAYYGLQTVMTAPDGTPTNAVHCFLMMLLKVIGEEKPDGVAVAFDLHAPTFRHLMYDGYKATRKPMPDDMRLQVPILREIISLMGIPILECEGYEADDILGTISKRCEDMGQTVLLLTGDRDSFQLSGANTTILYTIKGTGDSTRVTPEYIHEKYGVEPVQLIDVKSLMGDASDNIPGIAGIGEKTALKLIQKYGNLEETLVRGAEEEKGKLKERLIAGAESARMSRRLAEIERSAPVDFDLSAWRLDGLSKGLARMRELHLNVCVRRLTELTGAMGIEPAVKAEPVVEQEELAPVRRLNTLEELIAECLQADSRDWVAVHIGQDISVATKDACLTVPMGGDLLTLGIDEKDAVNAILPLLKSAQRIELWNVKTFPADSEELKKAFDVMLAAYVINPQRDSFEADRLCESEGITGFDACPAAAIHHLAVQQRSRLKASDSEGVFETLEMPLAFVLRDMERTGFLVDADALQKLGSSFDEKIRDLVTEIDGMLGEKVNLNSTKQLGELLFDKMGIPAPKKTKRGYSTSAEVLEELSDRYPVCAKILEYRKYQKLRSTYIDSLIQLRDENGRVHTHFEQVAAATGRLSSTEPNLQNIPVRTDIGREIRGAFIAEKGHTLIDADYSQIELRVLAHISGDETMIAAFCAGQDIHARTAAEVYGVPIEEVTSRMRSSCKAVNFGIVYGISEFALAKNIGVGFHEAKEFMERYFARYPGVREYMKRSVREAHEKGYSETLMGRRRYLPELRSSNFNVRSFGERCAMNSPIQGTAADIIKLAMIRVSEELKKRGMQTKLLLQVHDELILEAPDAEVEEARALLLNCMENVLRLDVPLKAEISEGGDWRACK